MSDDKPKSRRTVKEWEAEMAKHVDRARLLDTVVYDQLATKDVRDRLWKRLGQPVVVVMKPEEVRAATTGQADVKTTLIATVYRPEGPNPYVVVEERWAGDAHITVELWDVWERSVRDRERFWSDAVRALAERMRGALHREREGL